MKKKLLALAVVAICVATLASGSLAYFTAEAEAHNVITSHAVAIQLEEWQKTEDGLVAYPQDQTIYVMPGTAVSKIPQVQNLEADAYIRAQVQLSITDAQGNIMDLPQQTLDQIITLNVDTRNWLRKEGDSDWWYYASALKAGDTTEPFFTEVSFSGPNMTNEYQNCTLEVIVTAQGVQKANNGASAVEAAGWPAEPAE